MTIDSPILGLLMLPVAAIAFGLAGRRLAGLPRWLLRGGIIAALAAAPGVNLRCDRPPRTAVMVDLSPSTRGATFRDARSVTSRLTPLLAGRPFTLRYFADGELTTPIEPACDRTRLPAAPGVDAVVLFSDGRLAAPAASPPVFAVVDPSLDVSGDASVQDVRWTESGQVVIGVIGDGKRALHAGGVDAKPITPPRGPSLMAEPATEDLVIARFEAGDRWPENDAMAAVRAGTRVRRLTVGVAVDGFESITAAALPADDTTLSGVGSLVLSTTADVSAAQSAALASYVRDLGGSLVLVGPPGEASSSLQSLSPLSAVPPGGPGAWVILLDASGSMAADDGHGGTHWAAAVAAAREAVDRLPGDAAVTVMRFAGDLRTIAAGPPAAVRAALGDASSDPPSGRTGLRAALDALARRGGPARVLLLSDGDAELGDVDALAVALRGARLTLDAVAPSAALARLCAATGGRTVTDATPADWAKAIGGLAGAGGPAIEHAEALVGHDALANGLFRSSKRWPAWMKAGAAAVVTAARDAEHELSMTRPSIAAAAAAVWSAGSGRVVAVAAALSSDDLARIARRLERPASDPRFAVTFDEIAETVRLTATDAAGPMNGLSPRLTRDRDVTAFRQTGPSEYVAPLPRRPGPTVAVVTVGDAVITRHAVPGRYAAEFDAVGNDRDALAALASRTGGAVIEPGDTRPIDLPRRSVERSLRPALTRLTAVLFLAALLALPGRPRRSA